MRENRSTGLKMALAACYHVRARAVSTCRGQGAVPVSISRHLGPVSICALSLYIGPSIHRRNAARCGGSRCGMWFLLLRSKIRILRAGRPSFRISVYLGRWFQSCGPLGLRYSTGSRGLWPLSLSCNNRLSGCVSSPWCGRFRWLLIYYGWRFQSSALGRFSMLRKNERYYN